MAAYVTMLQVYKTTRYLFVERCLGVVQESRFLSPWEGSSVRIFPRNRMW